MLDGEEWWQRGWSIQPNTRGANDSVVASVVVVSWPLSGAYATSYDVAGGAESSPGGTEVEI